MPVNVEAKGGVTIVTIDRPEVRNAVDRPTAEALTAAFRKFDADPDSGVAILTGSDGSFCAGADLKALANDPERANHVEWRDGDDPGDGPMGPTRMLLDKPVIAAIEGYCVAGGLELALWCDLRVVARDATFGVFDRRWGVPLIDGGTIRLPRLIGQGRALDLILTGRAVDAQEALDIGLANRIAEPGEALNEATALAEDLLRYPQLSMRADRRSAIGQWGLEFKDALRNEFEHGTAAGAEEVQSGASRFASGHGRHGSYEDI